MVHYFILDTYVGDVHRSFPSKPCYHKAQDQHIQHYFQESDMEEHWVFIFTTFYLNHLTSVKNLFYLNCERFKKLLLDTIVRS